MRKVITAVLTVFNVLAITAAPSEQYLRYIAVWKDVAVQQQLDYGIPASITMAQALLESAAGTSELAVNARNHFGIKCADDWMGDVYRYDDDAKGECFRVYGDAAESFRDHSLFLQRPRYRTLFDIPVTDYQSWAHRLKECGYATDPSYAHKLIKIIQDYQLDSLYQTVSPTQSDKQRGAATNTATPSKPVLSYQKEAIATFTSDPEPEYIEPLTAAKEKELLFLTHAKKKVNGRSYITAAEGDSYANIAFRLNVPERSLRVWNDALGRNLQVGDRVFLGLKKAYGPKEKVAIWVSPGESTWYVSQREGVQLRKMLELNGLDITVRSFRTRQQILLRKVKE